MTVSTYRVIIAGSREIGIDPGDAARVTTAAESLIEIFARDFGRPIEIVSGGCRGADECGEALARANGFKLTVMAADWNQHGKAAGPIRNREMAKYASRNGSDFGAAIVFRLPSSRGSKSMIEAAHEWGLDVFDMTLRSVDR